MDLNVKIGADVGEGVKGVQDFKKELLEIPPAAKKVEDGMRKIVPGVNSAGLALTNVGRVAQDLPFGFIGIQNNLNPLLESFQRLKVEAGSNVGALKALGSSLIGAGGIGLALSVVSSGILLYQKYFTDATDTTKKADVEVKKITDSYDEFAKELEKVSATIGTEAAKVSILFSALGDANIGLRERKGIIEQLNQISPGYLGNLDKEKATYDEIAKAVFNYTESLAKTSEIKALLPQVDKLFQGMVNAQVQLNQLRRFQGEDPNDPGFFGVSPEDFKEQEKALSNSIKNFGNQIKIAKAGLTNFAGGEVNLSEILFGKTPELSKPAKEVKEKIAKTLKFKSEDLSKMFFDESTVSLKVPVSAELDFKKSLRSAGASEGLNGILGPEAFEELKMKGQLAGMGITSGIQVGINKGVDGLKFPELKALTESATKELEAFNSNMTGILQSTVTDLFVQLGENLGSGESLFAGFTKILGSGLKALGRQVILMSPIIKSLRLSFQSLNPALMLPAGIALVAIGAALSKAKIPGFAGGVKNFSGGLAWVGERGRELVNLPKGSDVIPNHRLGDIGAGSMAIEVTGRIEAQGTRMAVVIDRARQTIRRNN